MRLGPFLKLAIPLGTLAALALAYGIQRLASEPDPPINIQRPAPTTFRKLEPPPHGHKLMGKVTNPTGEAVDRALVWVRSGEEGRFCWTDALGAFRIDELGPGPWQSKVLALGFEPLSLELAESTPLQVVALKQALGPPPVLAKLEHAELAGRIVVPPDFDASGFEVVLEPGEPTRIDSAVPRRVACDAQGNFKIEDLIVAQYGLRVLPAWARGGTWPDLLLGVGDGAGEQHEFTHKQGAGELRLRLTLGTIAGALVEPDGRPIEGALVELELAGDPGRIWLPQSTDAAGKFALRALPRARYLLTLRAGGSALTREIELGPNEDHQLDPIVVPLAGGH
jgi:hypothetical protein